MEQLAQEFFELTGAQLTSQQIAALEIYAQELAEWNAVHNLTAIRENKQVRVKHFLDSLSACLAMRGSPVERVIDVGTGAGFPGLPLKILYPQMQLTLVESVGKKTAFCEHLIDKLGLSGVDVIQMRAEELGQLAAHREKYNWALARAVAIMPVLLEYLLPLVKVGGSVLAMKGESGLAEAHAAENAIQLLGGHLRQLVPLTLPGVVEERYLVVVDKVAATPEKYPRRVGIPAKRPL
jgi:16S rRNA (guanine527-N7)-methyltransferase